MPARSVSCRHWIHLSLKLFPSLFNKFSTEQSSCFSCRMRFFPVCSHQTARTSAFHHNCHSASPLPDTCPHLLRASPSLVTQLSLQSSSCDFPEGFPSLLSFHIYFFPGFIHDSSPDFLQILSHLHNIHNINLSFANTKFCYSKLR